MLRSRRRRHMVPIVRRPKKYSQSALAMSLMPFDPNNSLLRVKNEHSMHEKSICHRKLHRATTTSSLQQPRNKSTKRSERLRQCWMILCFRCCRHGEWGKLSGRSMRRRIERKHKRERDETIPAMLLICAFFHFVDSFEWIHKKLVVCEISRGVNVSARELRISVSVEKRINCLSIARHSSAKWIDTRNFVKSDDSQLCKSARKERIKVLW